MGIEANPKKANKITEHIININNSLFSLKFKLVNLSEIIL